MFSLRIVAAAALLGVSSPAARRPTPPAAVAPVARFPIHVIGNHVFIHVKAGAIETDFIFESGAPFSAFDATVARRAGYSLVQAGRIGGAGQGPGISQSQVKDGQITIAGTDITQPVNTALDLAGLSLRGGHEIGGLLGNDFHRRYVIEIDFSANEMRLFDRATYRPDPKAWEVPLQFAFGLPHANAEVELEDGERIRGPMTVDFGSGLSLMLMTRLADDHGLRTRIGPTIPRAGAGASGLSAMDMGRVRALRIGDATLTQVVTGLSRDTVGAMSGRGIVVAGTPAIGNIGTEVLRRFNVALDLTGARLFLTPSSANGEPFETDMSGLAVIGEAGTEGIVVESVITRSPAGEAGISANDRIVKINGTVVTMHDLDTLRDGWRKPGQRVEIVIVRGGEQLTRTFVTRRLI